MKLLTLLLIVINLLFSTALARTEPDEENTLRYESVNLPNTQIRHIHSDRVNQDYKLYINIPASYYNHPEKHYPVLYLLDADYSFPLASAIVEHLSDRGRIPEMLIVGIAYDGPPQYKLHRTRDYTPTYTPKGGYGPEYQKVSGGASQFTNFLSGELLPYVNKNFRVTSQKILAGHSYGGLFDTWLMLHKPTLFSGYIIVSPSLWYDQDDIFKEELSFSKTHKQLPAFAFFAVGSKENEGDNPMVTDMESYVNNLKSRDYEGLHLWSMVLAPEDHDTIFPTALTQGLLTLYSVNIT